MDLNFTLIAQALAFAAFIWIVARFIWPPLLDAIEERQKKIAEGLSAADQSRERLEQAEEEAQKILRDARSQANEIVEQAHTRANQVVEQAKHDAIDAGNRQKELAQADIEASTVKARDELRTRFAELAVQGAEKVIKREINQEAHRALLVELAESL